MEIDVRPLTLTSSGLYNGEKFVGLVSQIPDDPIVKNPGKWTFTIHTKDDGLWWFDEVFDNQATATLHATEALQRDWTFKQWKAAEELAVASAAAAATPA